MTCLHCKTRQASTSRLLCVTCYCRPSIRSQYPVVAKCRHCKRRQPQRANGLCLSCWTDPVIRADYPSEPKPKDRPQRRELTETMDDLERLIASRIKTMPKRKVGEE